MFAKRRIHITGASGAGVTSLGRALASHLEIPCHDTDDYYWCPTDPPYQYKRKISERLSLMEAMFLSRPAWVLSGALESWGGPIVHHFDHVIFLRTDTNIRMQRLRSREKTRIQSEGYGGDDSRSPWDSAFLDWASRYDDGDRLGRSLIRHETWISSLNCHVMRVDGARPVQDLTNRIVEEINKYRLTDDRVTGT